MSSHIVGSSDSYSLKDPLPSESLISAFEVPFCLIMISRSAIKSSDAASTSLKYESQLLPA